MLDDRHGVNAQSLETMLMAENWKAKPVNRDFQVIVNELLAAARGGAAAAEAVRRAAGDTTYSVPQAELWIGDQPFKCVVGCAVM